MADWPGLRLFLFVLGIAFNIYVGIYVANRYRLGDVTP
jgi:hypothetical protein